MEIKILGIAGLYAKILPEPGKTEEYIRITIYDGRYTDSIGGIIVRASDLLNAAQTMDKVTRRIKKELK